MKTICTMCKRSSPKTCGRKYCPILGKMSFEKRVKFDPKQEYFGDAPNVFVGRYGYPNVNVGILSAENYEHNDEPLFWSKENYDIGRIVDLRSVMVNSTFKVSVKNFRSRFLDAGKEVSLSSRPIDVEVGLEKAPSFRLAVDQDLMPQGPRVNLQKLRITENPKVPLPVERAVSDIDWKAGPALSSLYTRGIDTHHLTKLLSVGNLGVKLQRKLVPTRWAITAVDSNVSGQLLEEVKKYNEIDPVAYFGGHYGNYFLILFFPRKWSYELIETYVGNASMVRQGLTNTGSDFENYYGRKGYVEETAGAYYATRLALLENLKQRRKQASCLVLRFITDEYYVPLGVWVVREGVRKALQEKPITFSDQNLMLEYARKLIKKKFWGFGLDRLLKNSKLMTDMKQRTLEGY